MWMCGPITVMIAVGLRNFKPDDWFLFEYLTTFVFVFFLSDEALATLIGVQLRLQRTLDLGLLDHAKYRRYSAKNVGRTARAIRESALSYLCFSPYISRAVPMIFN